MPKPTFNTRQLLYKKYRLQGMNGKVAALKAGYSMSTATSKHKRIMPTMAEELERAGLTDRYLAEKVLEGTSAEKRDGNPDYYIQHKYLETGAKLKGHLQDKKELMIDKMNVLVYIPPPVEPPVIDISPNKSIDKDI